MPWFATNDCAAAANFGWFVGAHSGLFIDAMAVAMFVSARAFRYGAARAEPTERRRAMRLAIQALLRHSPWVAVIAWFLCGYAANAYFRCFATDLVIAAAAAAAPVLVLGMLTAANKVGRRGVRS
jgi:hypothetical protein